MEYLASIILAILALSFLIFIHELGHYFMARREGMRVETFSIGFGRPIFNWKWDGVKWQIGWLLFGGYVRIAGTDVEKDQDLYEVKDGFFGKSPWSRMKVAFMGPFVNILFALLVFALIWVGGGRQKNFSEYTNKAGWIDPQSKLYELGVRPGDEIWSLAGKPYQGMQDLLYVALTSSGPLEVRGAKVDYSNGTKIPFSYEISPYTHPSRLDKGLMTIGIMAPANYLIYDRLQDGKENPLPENSPLKNSGIQYGDRVIWADGHRIFSLAQLSNLLNDHQILMTVERDDDHLLVRVPRIQIQELKIDNAMRDELTDWQFASGLQSTKFSKLFVIPYNLSNNGVIENELHFIDSQEESEAFPKVTASFIEQPLQKGDRIVAIDGVPIHHASEILKMIQEPKFHIIVQRSPSKPLNISWRDADQAFDTSISEEDLDSIVKSIGTENGISSKGSLVLLKAITPKTHQEIYFASDQALEQDYENQKKLIASIEDPEKRTQLMNLLEQRDRKLELGLPIRDRQVEYNPVPTEQFMAVIKDIKRTLSALFSGSLNPKWMSGPVGIVHMFQEQTRSGFGDALYWLGVISLNLGILNLLPIPMLDGGTIVLSFFEAVSGKKIRPKTMEKLILPFAVLLIVFFIFLTYNDLSRLFGGFFR